MYKSKHPLPKNKQLHTVQEVSQIIRNAEAHYETPPIDYIVGGYVRDLLLGIAPSDIDVEVYGISFDGLGKLLGTYFGHTHITSVNTFALWSVAHNGYNYTYSLPRLEKKHGNAHTDFTITAQPDLPMREAVKRRDFTINTLFLDPLTGTLYDYTNGRRDIERRTLRAVDLERLAEDPLRVWRAIQHIGRFDMHIEKDTENALRKMANGHEIQLLSGPRVREEIDKLLAKSKNPSRSLTIARSWGLLSIHAPEVIEATPSEQDWSAFCNSLDALRDTDEHTQLQLRWRYILSTLTTTAQKTIISRLNIPKYIRNR